MPARDDIAELFVALEAAWNEADASAYARLFAAEATYVTRGGAIWRGRPAIAAVCVHDISSRPGNFVQNWCSELLF